MRLELLELKEHEIVLVAAQFRVLIDEIKKEMYTSPLEPDLAATVSAERLWCELRSGIGQEIIKEALAVAILQRFEGPGRSWGIFHILEGAITNIEDNIKKWGCDAYPSLEGAVHHLKRMAEAIGAQDLVCRINIISSN